MHFTCEYWSLCVVIAAWIAHWCVRTSAHSGMVRQAHTRVDSGDTCRWLCDRVCWVGKVVWVQCSGGQYMEWWAVHGVELKTGTVGRKYTGARQVRYCVVSTTMGRSNGGVTKYLRWKETIQVEDKRSTY